MKKHLSLLLAMGLSSIAYGQSRKIPVSEALEKVTDLYGTTFVYEADLLREKTTTLDLDKLAKQPKEELLKRILYPNQLLFIYIGKNHYMIVEGDATRPGEKTRSRLSPSSSPANPSLQSVSSPREEVSPASRQFSVSGTVADADGALPGVSVQVKGTSTGTSTGAEGKYTLANISPDATLVFRLLGYQTQEIMLSGRQTLHITMEPDIAGLDEVVVVGYGTQRKENVTGSVASVRSKELTAAPVANTTNMLAGRLPGLISQQTSGQPGADAANLSIRGFGDALVIVDGVETDFRFIDPNQIESITILKDASAAIYGSRAGNGVILVTTKRGSEGKPGFTFNTSQTLQGITIMPEPVNAGQYTELAREFHINSGQPEDTAPFTPEEIRKYKEGNDPLYPNTDWYGELIRPWAPQQQHNLSVRGGSDAIRYYGFLGYLDQETAFKTGGGSYRRYNFQSNIDAAILDNLNLQLTMASIIEDRDFPHTSMSTGEATVWGFLWNTLPIYPAHLPDPAKIPFADGNGTGGAHVVSNRNISGYNDNDVQNLRGSLTLNYDFKFVPGLSAKIFTNYENWNVSNKAFKRPVDLYTYDPASDVYTLAGNYNANGGLEVRHNKGRTLTGQFSLKYDNTFAGDHRITALALYEVIDNKSDYLFAARENFMTDILDQLYAGNSSSQENDGRAYENARVSYVGRLNYAYKNRYLLEAILRADATPVFPEESRWGYFPSISLGWRIAEEPFLKGMSFVDELKLRASYGQSGNDYASNNIYRYLSGYALTGDTYLLGDVNGKGFYSIGLPNPDITWEKVTTYNLGLDFAFFRQKLYGEADVFYREVSDILGTRGNSLPSTFGAAFPLENINSSNDRGFELRVGTAGDAGGLQWDVSGNISWSRAKWDHYDEPEFTDPDQERLYKNSGRWKDRQIGYLSDGLFTSMEEIDAWEPIQDKNGNTTLRPGDIRIVDINEDGIIDINDQVEIGKGTTPHWMYGFNTSLAYRNFDFSALIQGAFGYNTYIAFSQGKVYPKFVYKERWTEENNRRDALLPRVGGSGGGYNLAANSMRYKDAGYVRLKTVSLGYNLPKEWLNKVKIDQVRIYLAGTNLLTLDKLKKYNIDPETPSFNSGGGLAAHTGRYYPQQKTLSLGASISF